MSVFAFLVLSILGVVLVLLLRYYYDMTPSETPSTLLSETPSTDLADTVASTNNAVLMLAPGNYAVSESILITKPIRIEAAGPGVSITATKTMGVVFDIRSSHVTIRNITFMLNGNADGVSIYADADSVHILDNVFVKAKSVNIAASSPPDKAFAITGLRISGNKIQDSMGFGITIYKRSDAEVSDIHISDNHINGTSGHAIVISGGSNIRILDNHIENTNNNRPHDDDLFGHAIAVDGDSGKHPVCDLRVSGNQIRTVFPAILKNGKWSRAMCTGIEIADGIFNAMITNNTVRDIRGGYGIYLGGHFAAGFKGTISGNIVDGAMDCGILVHGGYSYVVTGNVVKQCHPAGILLCGIAHTMVTGNVTLNTGGIKQCDANPTVVAINNHDDTADATDLPAEVKDWQPDFYEADLPVPILPGNC